MAPASFFPVYPIIPHILLFLIFLYQISSLYLMFQFFRYIVFVLQLPAYLPIYLASEMYGRASAEFSITLLLVVLSNTLCPDLQNMCQRLMALYEENNNSKSLLFIFQGSRDNYTKKMSACKADIFWQSCRNILLF